MDRSPIPGAGSSWPPTSRNVLTTTSAGDFMCWKRAFLKESELNNTRRMERMSNFESRNAPTNVSIAFWSRGGSIGQAGTCGSSATEKLYRCRQKKLTQDRRLTAISHVSYAVRRAL